MAWTSIVAIYFLFWVGCAFVMLPFGIRTPDEIGEHDDAGGSRVTGQADSAPVNFRPGRLALRATVVAAGVTALWVANWNHQWITVGDLDWWGGPPDIGEFSDEPQTPPQTGSDT